MELTWLADTPQSRNRTRALRACSTCQRRKKRCRHLPHPSEWVDKKIQSSNLPGQIISNNDLIPPSDSNAQTQLPEDPAMRSLPSTERFVGDLNPEALIRERLDEPAGSPLKNRIGVWLRTPSTQDSGATVQGHHETSRSENRHTISTLLQHRYTSALTACNRLPASTREPLIAIYCSKVNPIIPLLDTSAFLEAQDDGVVSVFLERAICLVAAKDPTASPYLRLTDHGASLSSRQFCSELYKGLAVAMDALLEPDRVTRIRVLALMSLHCEGHEGAEAASSHLCQAIHQAQTIGLHLDRPDRAPADPLAQLFWSLWTLDKMHASIGGRPVLLADRDIGAEKPRSTEAAGAFGVGLNCIFIETPTCLILYLGLLELYYHSVAILSCRHKPNDSLDNTRISSIRQGLAAVRVHSIVASEGTGDLPPLPIVPYAVALSMGVAYRQLRSSKLITHSKRAKASLEACCTLLESLSSQWYSAEAMARLGRKALQQTERDQATSNPEPPRDSRSGPRQGPSGPPVEEESLACEDRVVSDGTAVPQMHDLGTSMGPIPEIQDPDVNMAGFAEIDTLFGEFLDLSLPTNFWDPIFAEQDPSGP
ncbi:hypothetical protein N7468_010486 [Penicillium chermesinum]|uniref:Xylanolytic transcriptional activator regulatory domain-containing protein n=1 Tax=Penicillium chermesinum TaxID=63820 RepID=A0A9W9N7U7_9EURO|nr:uncharacterized protein N7468_010486 [Penicillium chermesinum]KAJ5214807.1 hypothetical protein N7468_010486 [Penicillium chermesinum]